MPRTIFDTSEGITKPIACYDLFYPVGYNFKEGPYTNHPRDVAFVQFLLSGIFETMNHKPYGRLVVDGKFGATTHYWILFYQHMLRIRYNTYLASEDGYAFPYYDTMKAHYLTFRQSMMGWLNYHYRIQNPHIEWNKLATSAHLPGILKRTFADLGTGQIYG
jgi:hypothetical protein